jgi:hypothetical protein
MSLPAPFIHRPVRTSLVMAAIFLAGLLRFRPITMTTPAALLTGLPLMLDRGAGSEFRNPLGVAMVGGLLLSQALTLYTTPVVYLYLDALQRWLAPGRRARACAGTAHGCCRGGRCKHFDGQHAVAAGAVVVKT